MEFLVTAPEILATTAADVGKIRSALTDVNANAAGRTTALVAAAKDEVSEAIAKLFGGYGQQYQAVLAKAATFHDEFTRALGGAGNTYANAETTNAALLATEAPQTQQIVALIMGGTWNPYPGPVYLNNVNLSYILPHFPGAIPLDQLTPEQFWPVAGTARRSAPPSPRASAC